MTRRGWLFSSIAASQAGLVASAAEKPLPGSITRLKSRSGEAKPITVEERRARIERARTLMEEHKLGAVCVPAGSSLRYFSGIRWWGSERLFLMILPRVGEPVFVAPAFELGRAQEGISQGPCPRAEVIVWQEDESPYDKVALALRDRGLLTGRIGIEETTPFVFSQGICAAVPALTLVSATPVTAGCRMIKSPAEIALMRLASSVTLQAYAAAWEGLTEGMTNTEFAGLISAAHRQLGLSGGAMVLAGEASALPHGSGRPQVIREGSIVLIDGECTVDGYVSDVTRTFTLGAPSAKMKSVFGIVRQAQDAALRAARPGAACESVDSAARTVVTAAGYGPGYKYLTHRLGHGMGLDGHEWPYLVQGNKQSLSAGMVFSDEPGIYIPGEFGVRLEDDMLITPAGAELFTKQSDSLEKPFAA